MTEQPARWKPKNVHEELWNIVDLHLITSADTVLIDVHAVETGADDSTEETGRCLLTVRAHIPSPERMDVWHSSWDLADVMRNEWKVPSLVANLLYYASDMGLAVVREPGMGFTGDAEENIPVEVVALAEESEEAQVARLVDEYGTIPAFGHPEAPC